jgi:diphthine methyl ester synthase
VRAVEAKVEVEVIHNASILNAVGFCGLQLYRFGHAVSLCFWTETWKPDSWYERVAVNRKHGLHTLFLLGT